MRTRQGSLSSGLSADPYRESRWLATDGVVALGPVPFELILRRIAEGLRVDFVPYGAPMSFMDRKGRYYKASNLLRNRDAIGMARREKTPR